jgi:hypothetical protein
MTAPILVDQGLFLSVVEENVRVIERLHDVLDKIKTYLGNGNIESIPQLEQLGAALDRSLAQLERDWPNSYTPDIGHRVAATELDRLAAIQERLIRGVVGMNLQQSNHVARLAHRLALKLEKEFGVMGLTQ